ncbi:unnamed protein product, partial [Coregonus sp. 'balchen']
MFPPSFSLKKLCKFCDVESSSCNGTGSCLSNCSITAICPQEEEVCIAICSMCAMKEKKSSGGPFFICSCTEEECNDNLSFTP